MADRHDLSEVFGDLPTWAVLLLGVLAAAILIVLNLGWVLAVRAMLDGQRRKGRSAPAASTAEREEPTRSSAR